MAVLATDSVLDRIPSDCAESLQREGIQTQCFFWVIFPKTTAVSQTAKMLPIQTAFGGVVSQSNYYQMAGLMLTHFLALLA